jgi:hypothetical protein
LAQVDGPENDAIQLGYGLGVGTFSTPYGRAFFKEGHDEGWGHYSVCFPDKKIAMVIITNHDRGESIFKELIAYAIGDVYTPWKWEQFIPYNYVPPPVVNIYAVSTEDLDPYIGVYSSKELPIKIAITKQGTSLMAQATGQSSFTLQAIAKHVFAFEDEGIVFTFDPIKKEMTLQQSGQVYKFIQ